VAQRTTLDSDSDISSAGAVDIAGSSLDSVDNDPSSSYDGDAEDDKLNNDNRLNADSVITSPPLLRQLPLLFPLFG
jgi:hypothetical protein